MKERAGAVTLKGEPLTLVGPEVSAGQPAPDFTAVANDMTAVSFCSFRGRICILLSVPSLDTPVCNAEARRFNQEVSHVADDVTVLVVSMDLPFAQARWCAAAGVERVSTLSDHRDGSFGMNYGVLIRELRLLARAVFVVDRAGTIRYTQLVKEIGDEPDYGAALRAVRELCAKREGG